MSEDNVVLTLSDAVQRAMPQLHYQEEGSADLHIMFTVTDYIPEHFGCSQPRWYWTAAVDTWIPVPGSEPAEVTFVALAEFAGRVRAGSDAYGRQFASSLAKVAAKPEDVPPSSIHCISDSWFQEVGPVSAQTVTGGCSRTDVAKLLDEWRHADWRLWFRVGWAFSNCAVTNDDLFFRAMLSDKHSFDGWLLGLNGHTFMYSDEKDIPRLEQLKERMTTIATRASANPEYGDLAKALLQRLTTVTISEARKIVN